ncbi:MAG TPA: HNH endonuclease signature motif containing protein [Kribbellaceae bacterium]
MIARDGGCVIPGCDAPPGQCDAHHLEHWADGGETAIDKLVLACKPHHRAAHKGAWHIRILNGTVHVTRPTWADPGTAPPSDGAADAAEARPPPAA